ncbi:MAG: hypothetical protein K1X67_05380 [Fimbriimonadaceae bacterium]|nr:hypothetical protein [Fimbriimonadaceae bacterium]
MPLTVLASILLSSAGLQTFQVVPSATDPRIKEFDSPHVITVSTTAKPNNQLLLFIPGTNGKPGRVSKFSNIAAEQGFQVINLMYPDTTPATMAAKSTDPNAFINFRREIIEGKDLSTYVSVDRTNCIENRLIKLLQYLTTKRPNENWGQYLTSSGDIDWSKFVVSGLSQGAGHACVIALLHKVSRAVMFGGPKDYDRATNSPASYYTMQSATPKNLMFTFNNMQDKQGCDYQEQIQNCTSLGLIALAPFADVDKVKRPFNKSHVLFTNWPGTPVTSVKAHTSVIQDAVTPTDKSGKPIFQPVWMYMLTHK